MESQPQNPECKLSPLSHAHTYLFFKLDFEIPSSIMAFTRSSSIMGKKGWCILA